MKKKYISTLIGLAVMAGGSFNAQAESKSESTIFASKLDCSSQPENPFVAAVVGVALKSIFSIIFESVDDSIGKKLAKYQQSEDFRLELANIESYKCITISRDKGANTNYLKIQYNVEAVTTGPSFIYSFKLRPYKVAGQRNPYGPKGNKFAFSNSVKASAIGSYGPIQISANKSENLLSVTYKDKFPPFKSKPKNLSEPVFHVTKSKGEALPVTLIFTHSEVGYDKKKASLKRWRTFVSKSSEGLSETFTAAITELIETEEASTAPAAQ